MTSRDFCFWLQGLFELARPEELNKEQTLFIRKHLNMVSPGTRSVARDSASRRRASE